MPSAYPDSPAFHFTKDWGLEEQAQNTGGLAELKRPPKAQTYVNAKRRLPAAKVGSRLPPPPRGDPLSLVCKLVRDCTKYEKIRNNRLFSTRGVACRWS